MSQRSASTVVSEGEGGPRSGLYGPTPPSTCPQCPSQRPSVLSALATEFVPVALVPAMGETGVTGVTERGPGACVEAGVGAAGGGSGLVMDRAEWQTPPDSITTNASINFSTKCISVYYSNARSVRNNLAELHVKLYDEKYSVVCISESWLCSNFKNSMLDPRSLFNIYRRDRTARWPAGGVCIFIHREIKSCLDFIDSARFPDSEIIACNIYPVPNIKICLICAYLPPNLSPIAFHECMLYLEALFSQKTC